MVFCSLQPIMLYMSRQMQKLVVILNFCFWGTVGLRFFRGTRALPPDLLNIIVVLGMSAIAFNAGYAGYRLFLWMKKRSPISTNKWLDVFILLSFLIQLFFLIQSSL
jgi:hypothetical protein